MNDTLHIGVDCLPSVGETSIFYCFMFTETEADADSCMSPCQMET